MVHLIRRRQWPVFLPNDQHYRHTRQDLTVNVTELRPRGTVLVVEGQLVRHNADLLKQTGTRLLDSGRQVIIINLAKTHFVDSAGLGAIVALHKRIHQTGGQLALCHLSENVRRSLQLVRLDRVFKIYRDQEEALRQMPPAAALVGAGVAVPG